MHSPSGIAQTQTESTQRENAQALYKAGNDARDAGDSKTAAARYQAAYALVPTPVIAVALGKAQVALGQLIEGRQTLLGVRRIAAKDRESALTTAARAEAVALAAEIEPRIPTVTIGVTAPEGSPLPTVAIDGVTLPEGALNAPWKLNPGPHTAVATLREARTETQFNVAEAEVRAVTLDYPAAASAPSAEAAGLPLLGPTSAVPVERISPHSTKPASSVRGSSRIPAYVALGIGGAGVVVTTVFGVMALHDQSALDGLCKAGKLSCPPNAQPDIDGLHTSSIASDVGLGVAAAGIGVGIAWLLFRGKSESSPPPDAARAFQVAPWLNPRGIGMTGSF